MPNQEDKVRALFQYPKKSKILEGKVWVQGGRMETPERRITYMDHPLYFDPPLGLAKEYDPRSMVVLLDYLKTFQPVDRRGMIFFPQGIFYLNQGECLQLSMWDDRPWGQGISISVFEKKLWDSPEFEEAIKLLEERKVSGFVFGRFRDRKNYPFHTVLRRYFSE